MLGKSRCVLLHFDSSKRCVCPLYKFLYAFKVVKLFLKHPVYYCVSNQKPFCCPVVRSAYENWRVLFLLPSHPFPSPWLDSPCGPKLLLWVSSITLTTLTRTPLDEWSARRRDPSVTTHNTCKRQTSMPPAGFEPAIPANERPQITVLDRAATGIDFVATWL
jgi:hypothetical protein